MSITARLVIPTNNQCLLENFLDHSLQTFIMINSADQNISSLEQDEITNMFIPVFSIPTHTEESPIMKISLDIIPDSYPVSTTNSVRATVGSGAKASRKYEMCGSRN